MSTFLKAYPSSQLTCLGQSSAKRIDPAIRRICTRSIGTPQGLSAGKMIVTSWPFTAKQHKATHESNQPLDPRLRVTKGLILF